MGRRKPRCFLICPIGSRGSAVRKRSDSVERQLIVPALKQLGYYSRPDRADRISRPGIITSQIIEHVVRSDLVVADLTGGNPNVFYEVAIRHVARKPLVMIVEEAETIPFDVRAARAITFNHLETDSLRMARSELVKQVRSATSTDEVVFNPVSVALDMLALKAQSEPQRTLVELVERIFDVVWEADGALGDVKTAMEDLHHEIESLGVGQGVLNSRLADLELILMESV